MTMMPGLLVSRMHMGGTIIHWDGIHWQRWFQKELPIPPQDLYTVNMVSANDGWAGGEVPSSGGPALILHWDGYRWAPPRYDAPVNVAVNDLTMLDHDFGWAVADYGNGVAKYDGYTGYWSANHTCYDNYYRLRSGDIIDDIAPTPPAPAPTPAFKWDAWAVGSWHDLNTGARIGERFLRYRVWLCNQLCLAELRISLGSASSHPDPPTASRAYANTDTKSKR